MLKQESLFVAIGARGDELYMRRFRLENAVHAQPALLLHGAIENGRIFYSEAGDKGLAPFLAAHGFDVFVADLRGRGHSRPHIDRHATHGQTEAIIEDLAALTDTITKTAGPLPQHWLAHSWGGVLMASHLARFPERATIVASLTCFGTKRSVSVSGLAKLMGIDIVWNRFAPFVAWLVGYFPAKSLGLGADDETRRFLRDSIAWVDPCHPWTDPRDAFDYATAVTKSPWPRTLLLAGAADAYLGHPVDVCRFARECGLGEETLHLLARRTGHLHDYDHINMLTHADAVRDHFPMIATWLQTGRRPGQ